MIKNADWILTKNDIIKKTIALLEVVQVKQHAHLHKAGKLLPAEALKRTPKISKGENYKGLPYLVLDYPRVFDKKNIFAIRTMFWWGNFFSITLHLSGQFKKQFEKKMLVSYSELKKAGFSVCINHDEWEHHFEESNYFPLTKIRPVDFKKNITGNSFVKVAKKYSLQNWETLIKKLMVDFRKIINLVEH